MTVRPIVVYPDPRLKTVSHEFTATPEELQLVSDLRATMLAARGLGIAAIQVGVPTRLIVVGGRGGESSLAMANPVIVSMDGDVRAVLEGCLSFPGVFETVRRHTKVVARWQDPFDMATTREEPFRDIRAQVLQHEVEHLQGVTLASRWSRARRGTVTGQLKKYGRAF